MKLMASHLDHARSVLARLTIVCLALAFKNAPGAEILVESLPLPLKSRQILNDINAFRSKDQKCDGRFINTGEEPFEWDKNVEQVAKQQSAYMAEHNTLRVSIDEIARRVDDAVRKVGYVAASIKIILGRGNYKEAIKALLDEPTKYQKSCEYIMSNYPSRAGIAIGSAIRIESNSEKRFWILIMFATESIHALDN